LQFDEARIDGKEGQPFPSQAPITSMQWPQALLLFGYLPPTPEFAKQDDRAFPDPIRCGFAISKTNGKW
jgi:hypothetical protein